MLYQRKTQHLAYAYKIRNKPDFSLIIDNPNQERIFIYVFDSVNKNIYWEKMDMASYRRSFNFEGMQNETYNLVVTTADKKYQYTKKIEANSSEQIQPVEQSVPIILTSTESDF